MKTKGEQIILDYTASTNFKQIKHLNWTTAEVIDILNRHLTEDKPQTKKAELVKYKDDMMEYDVTECCGIGPITNENYCPNCGLKLNK